MVELMARRRRERPGRGDARRARRRACDSEISLICVGTPSAPNGSQDQTAMLRLAKDLGRGAAREDRAARLRVPLDARARARSRTCCVRSSRRESGKKDGIDFHVCFQPEFLREGSSIRDYDKPPFTIVGANAERAGRQAARALRPPAVRVPSRRRSARPRWSSTAATTSTRSRSRSPTRPRACARRSASIRSR